MTEGAGNYVRLNKIAIMNEEKNNFDQVNIWFSGGGFGKVYDHSAWIMIRRVQALFDLKNQLRSELNTDGEKNHLNYFVSYNEVQMRKIVEMVTKQGWQIITNTKEKFAFKLPEAVTSEEFKVWHKDEETKNAQVQSFLKVPAGNTKIYVGIKDLQNEMLILIRNLPKEMSGSLGAAILALSMSLYDGYFALAAKTADKVQIIAEMEMTLHKIIFLIGGFFETQMTQGARIIRIGAIVLALKKELAAL